MLGRDLDAQESLELGLLDLVVADDELTKTAQEWAAEIAANAPLAVQGMKRLFREGLSEPFRPHSAKVLAETMRLFGTDDFHEGITAFAEGQRTGIPRSLTARVRQSVVSTSMSMRGRFGMRRARSAMSCRSGFSTAT